MTEPQAPKGFPAAVHRWTRRRQSRDAALAEAVHELRLAYRDPNNWRSVIALERLRAVTRGGRQLRAAAARAFALAMADGPQPTGDA